MVNTLRGHVPGANGSLVTVAAVGTYVLEKARLVTLEVDAVGALAEVDSEVMLSSDLQNVVAHSNT